MKAIFKMALTLAITMITTQAFADIVFYENEGFSGRSFTTNRQVSNLYNNGFNDRASSAIVLSDRWEVCSDSGFNGDCIYLRPGRYSSLDAMGMNNSVSSARMISGTARYDEQRYAPDPEPVYDNRRRNRERLYTAYVTSVRAVIADSGQRCWIERDQVEPDRSRSNVPGTVLGAEIAVVGFEGIVGVSLFMGGETTPSRAVVQSAGQGYRLKASLLMQEFNRGGPVMHLLLRYTQALITQMSQTAVCNRHHSLDQQLCRWLLLSLDRLASNDLVMTQELIANMLGVRREGVTEAAGHLQEAGLIAYRRGQITVLDRAGLEKRTCECYAVVKKEYDRLLPLTTAT